MKIYKIRKKTKVPTFFQNFETLDTFLTFKVQYCSCEVTGSPSLPLRASPRVVDFLKLTIVRSGPGLL